MKQILLFLILIPLWVVSAGHLFGDTHINGQRKLDSRSERLLLYYGQYLLKDDHKSFVRPDWDDATRKAQEFLKDWTIEELVTLTSGVGWARDNCVGNIAAIPHKDFPGLCLEDSPLGVRFADRVSVFPAGVNTAATFDRDLMRRRGVALGKEFRGKGVHVALGPMMNMARVPEGGRNFEGFGADPYLAGEAAFETVAGMQSQGVQACAKHYLNNEQEHGRRTTTSEVSDRAQHEIYLHPFLRSVQAGVASIMCSYNLINGTYACENDGALNGWLKGELGFEGYVMSDWEANHSTESTTHGLDMTMPGVIKEDGTDEFFGNRLVKAVKDGRVKRERLRDMVTRIVAGWFVMGQDSNYPDVNFNAFSPNGTANKHIDVQDDHHQLIRKIGAASTVLLKNLGSLPLKQPRSLALIGSDAGPALKGPNWYPDRAGLDGVVSQGWGSGTADLPYLISPLEAIQARAREDHTSLSWYLNDFDLQQAAHATLNKDTVIVFIAATAGEEYLTVDGNVGDRNNLTAWNGGDDLVEAVAAHNPNTIVVVHSVGPILMPWANHENITGIVWAGVPGQEAGNSLADVLYGDWNPSGRLPYTIAKKESDYKARIPWNNQEVHYSEGLNIDYRAFDVNGIEPLFEFGFGLSYSKFEYFGLHTSFTNDFAPEAENWLSGIATSGARKRGSALEDWLHRKLWTVKFKLQNAGTFAGTEVPQLYIAFPEAAHAPPRVLRGFENVMLTAGETDTVKFRLSRYDLSIWSVEQQAWIAPGYGSAGEDGRNYILHVGASSRDFRLKAMRSKHLENLIRNKGTHEEPWPIGAVVCCSQFANLTASSIHINNHMARNLSIWLLPGINTPEYQGIGEIINYLADKHGNTPFPPHVTLSMLPVDFPLEVVRDVVEEMKEEWFSKHIEFETIFTTLVGIAVHGKRGSQTTRGGGGAPIEPPKGPPVDLLRPDQVRVPTKKKSFIKRIVQHVTSSQTPSPPPPAQAVQWGGRVALPGSHQQLARVNEAQNDAAGSTVLLQQRFHYRLQEEVQKRRLAGTIAADTPDVRNIVPWFPHLSLAYTERGQEEGIKEIAEKGWYSPAVKSRPDEPFGIELAGFKSYKFGAIYLAYCGGLKPEKWTVFERIEEAAGTGQGANVAAV